MTEGKRPAQLRLSCIHSDQPQDFVQIQNGSVLSGQGDLALGHWAFWGDGWGQEMLDWDVRSLGGPTVFQQAVRLSKVAGTRK